MKPKRRPRLTFRLPHTRLRDLPDDMPAPRALRQITTELSALWDKPTEPGPDERPALPPSVTVESKEQTK
jgi:hypothetical protein